MASHRQQTNYGALQNSICFDFKYIVEFCLSSILFLSFKIISKFKNNLNFEICNKNTR